MNTPSQAGALALRAQRGLGAIEFLVVLPLLLVLGLGVWQWALVMQARQLLEHAALEAVRGGALTHASEQGIDQALARGLIPFWAGARTGGADERATHSMERLRWARDQGWMEWRLLSPTRQSFFDWAEASVDAGGRSNPDLTEIPIDNLDARIQWMRPTSGIAGWLGSEPIGISSAQTLRDASVLRIELQVALPLTVPFAGRAIGALAASSKACAPPCLLKVFASDPDRSPRLLVRVHAESRMHSPPRLSARTPERTQSANTTPGVMGSSMPVVLGAPPASRGSAAAPAAVEVGEGQSQQVGTASPTEAGPLPDAMPDASSSVQRPLDLGELAGEIGPPQACRVGPD